MKLRVLTANLYNGRVEPDSLATVLRTHTPDVVAVQELSDNCAAVLADWGKARHLDSRDDLTGMGIAVRGEATFSRLDFPNRRPVVATIVGDDWDLPAGLEIVNVHLVNPIARPLARSRLLRSQELVALEAVLTDPSPTARILVGDLNSSPAWPIYRHLTRFATDAAVAAGTARRTWGPWPSSSRLLRIDHAFVQGVKPLRTEIVSLSGGDHSGLLVDVVVDR
jgi:endonuclease/exonuclease/phosphatase family metal-dependent hydrolase